MKLRRPRGLQLEIVTSLFVVMLAGLGIVAVVMVSLAARTIESAALGRLRTGAEALEQRLESAPQRLGDVAPLAYLQAPRIEGASFRVLDERGAELGLGPPREIDNPELLDLLERARVAGEVVARGGLPPEDLVLVRRLTRADGESGFLVARLARDRLLAQLMPLLGAGAWMLFTAAAVFVAFGGYLLRRRIVLPLQALSHATQQVARGDLSVRTEVSGANELTDLARGFNTMAASLEHENAALLRAQESLYRSRRLANVGQLAAGVAHEVGNPLAAILGYSEVLLRDDSLSDRSREMAERTRSEALRVRDLVREMLDLTRAEAVELAPHPPSALLENSAERMRAQPVLVGIELCVAPSSELVAVYTDARRVEQILVNLIENAAHALRGIPQARIELAAAVAPAPHAPRRRSDDGPSSSFAERRRRSAVAITVVDNGPGIDAEDLHQVFDPFFTTKDPGEGTGLGLSNAHRLADLLDATLEAESRPGRTCFRLILPVADTEDGHVQPPHPDR